MSASYNVRNIMDMPDEILVEILVNVNNARERAMLGNLSERFYRLVFKDTKLLRNLDFSDEGHLTSALDIHRYFSNTYTNKHILKVNLKNVNCMAPGLMLNVYIGKALNLVNINIHGTKLKDIPQLECFLKPLIHLRRLSMNWPIPAVDDSENENLKIDKIYQALREPFGRLTYLSLETYCYECLREFILVSDSCQELKELHLFQSSYKGSWKEFRRTPSKLSNLEIFQVSAQRMGNYFKTEFYGLLPDIEEWTEFKPYDPHEDEPSYYEKNLTVCKELMQSQCVAETPYRNLTEAGFYLRTECLLKAVIRITCEKVPDKFCSSEYDEYDEEQCKLKIEDAKLLLKNPRHQIKYLYLGQSIGTECDVHLYALASPGLTELYLSDVMKIKISTSKQTSSKEHPIINGNLENSTFKMLVENTSHVKDLTLNGREFRNLKADEAWDLGALSLICGWKYLESLRLLYIPIYNGEFLIEIGKQCKYLKKLEFFNLGSKDACCYTKELLQMFTHCQNLTDFSMYANNIRQVSDVFVSLTKNLQLRRVRLTSFGEGNDTLNLVSSVELLLRCCSKLTTFVCIIDGISQAESDQLTSALQRLRTELNRPTLQFQVVRNRNFEVTSKIDTVCEDFSPPFFPYNWDQFSYV